MLPRRTLFGISVTPYAASYAALVEQVRAAERGGLDLVGIQDHPYQRRFLDTFALIADLLARTERLHVFPDVASLPFRPPTLLAKTAASLDVMSGGRFELGMGAGAFWDAVAGMGGPRRGAGESIDALEEAVRIVRAALDGERVVRAPGPHYPVPGYPPGPPPAHRVEIWLGVYRPRGLALAGRLADGWVPSLGRTGIEALRRAAARLDEAALAAGRDPRDVRRILNVSGTITDGSVGEDALDGPPALWVERLAGLARDPGVDAFIFWPPDEGTVQVERFAAEVAPAVLAALG
ncbi:MAG TPA: LLM class flavin-dependent oxidoreductase [candidate division Zixibacteria bacterium]|nr:LLM class flavin-dependent oxidoreductase [candidate division Zixibacteria bacterium]